MGKGLAPSKTIERLLNYCLQPLRTSKQGLSLFFKNLDKRSSQPPEIATSISAFTISSSLERFATFIDKDSSYETSWARSCVPCCMRPYRSAKSFSRASKFLSKEAYAASSHERASVPQSLRSYSSLSRRSNSSPSGDVASETKDGAIGGES
ncbi:hypothetical protein AMTR_s00073p00146740 [Amborella trichopoda]|uniref:Uncharacterized protein n=1 Tax=Amborella trichopoda TaxID=13333 RepID=W1NRK0_AMBTC|nr:hypothetical protein AMTR_s00073p00146740 [Amborella trichopoda]